MDTKCTGVLWRCEGITENVDVEVEGGICVRNKGAVDRSAADIFVGYW